MAGITTLTGGVIARWEEIGRNAVAVGSRVSCGSCAEEGGRGTEPMSRVPLVRRTARTGRPGCLSGSKGGFVTRGAPQRLLGARRVGR
ncbi:hypothetical protein GCM10009564_24380 [Streptomyces thermogriseus]|uniref:Uncharacterized protein n=1 Tax=Streptomyces thermogriseus TaxID=75292 RepID=A0ABN1SYD0_9ACTN